MMSKQWKLRHPTETVIRAVVELTDATQTGRAATLTLKQADALLTHLRDALAVALDLANAAPVGRCVICSAQRLSPTTPAQEPK
jgi:hypothetical protein